MSIDIYEFLVTKIDSTLINHHITCVPPQDTTDTCATQLILAPRRINVDIGDILFYIGKPPYSSFDQQYFDYMDTVVLKHNVSEYVIIHHGMIHFLDDKWTLTDTALTDRYLQWMAVNRDESLKEAMKLIVNWFIEHQLINNICKILNHFDQTLQPVYEKPTCGDPVIDALAFIIQQESLAVSVR